MHYDYLLPALNVGIANASERSFRGNERERAGGLIGIGKLLGRGCLVVRDDLLKVDHVDPPFLFLALRVGIIVNVPVLL